MNIALPLEKMTTVEKIEAMEMIWKDLSKSMDDFESPAWHGQILQERIAKIKTGLEVPIELSEAINQLRGK
jgi:hypothetical protein